MALGPDYKLAELALNAIERVESKVLVWGLVDSSLSSFELMDCLRSVLDTDGAHEPKGHPDCTISTSGDLRDFLVAQRLLFLLPLSSSGEVRWRTRMAEGIRLLAQLRQLFRRHSGDTQWIAAPTLVADFRFLWRPRRYPKRECSWEEAYAAIQAVVEDPNLLVAVGHWLQRLPLNARLAKFQIDSSVRILNGLVSGVCRGTLVSAGTGSGKTLSFYLPALSWLAYQREVSPKVKAVRVLGLYPRNELLKDQLLEVFGQCRKFDDLLSARGKRPLRVGVLYGDTPHSVRSAFGPYSKWKGGARERICPFMRCPDDACSGDMILRKNDLEHGLERLTCASCGNHVDETCLVFTRTSMESNPPDILFTSVEMLNQNLANTQVRHLFGVGVKAAQAPDLVLLDEVHLYAGTYGAQVGYLLRRWWALSGRRSSFVGLSATIAEGRRFFATLTGLEESVVEVITPHENDMIEEGGEYLVALRGDPVSQTALLSTSIQSLMLLARLLDPRDGFDFRRRPFSGWRAFAFTDQLDATNRLFKNLLDAEGRYPDGNRNTSHYPDGGLARLRAPINPVGRRYLAGQDWRALSTGDGIGHDLNECLEVGRTTSLDSGVSQKSQVVVATASLEVGFDDPEVGVVLQHKAPRDVAQFLQRKGRAGRTRHMRPWTVVVLSDYGRDRLAYQAYDQLFDPLVAARDLPMTNRYVQRMQAVYALIDELGRYMQVDPIPGAVWRDLARPLKDETPEHWKSEQFAKVRSLARDVTFPLTTEKWNALSKRAVDLAPNVSGAKWLGKNWLQARLRQQRLVELLANILKSTDELDRCSNRVGELLGLSRESVEPLLWSQPRPLFLGAIPTLLRRLATNWRSHDSPSSDHQAGHPLPDFIPAALFSDLSLPEMEIILPQVGRSEEPKFMPVLQGLSEFAPGRVSMRYDTPLWLGVNGMVLNDMLDSGEEVVELEAQLSDWYQLDHRGVFHHDEQGVLSTGRAFRPVSAKLQDADLRSVGVTPVLRLSDTSNAQLDWVTQLLAPLNGTILQAPTSVGIADILPSVTFHTHASHSEAVVKRYAVGSRADLKLTVGQESRKVVVKWRFMDEDHPAGVGFDQEVDALVFELKLPDSLHQKIDWSDPARARAARSARFSWEALHGCDLSELVLNVFVRSWLAQIFQTAALLVAEATKCDLRIALDGLGAGEHLEVLLDVLYTVFQAPSEIDDDLQDGADRLRQELQSELSKSEVRRALRSVADVLVDPVDATWDQWLSCTIRTTLGAAVLDAIQQACPQVNGDALWVDVDPGLSESGAKREGQHIWVSEANPGGNGLIEQVVDLLISQPERLYRHIEAALSPQEFETIDMQLRDTLQRLGGPSRDRALIDAFASVRRAESSGEAQVNFGRLRAELVRVGHAVFHGYAVALSLRLLRQDSPESLDELLAEVQLHWDELEKKHGIEIDVRLICALYSNDGRLDRTFAGGTFELPDGDRKSWRFSVLMGILWARGHALRSKNLPLSNRFVSQSCASERILLGQWLTPREEPIDPRTPGWAEKLRERLIATNRATVAMPVSEAASSLAEIIREVVTEPVQFEYLNVFARLHSIRRVGESVEWTFEIPETA